VRNAKLMNHLKYCLFLTQIGTEPGYAWLDYLDPYNYFENQRGQLESPLITGPRCMTFYFYIHGNRTGFLNIETKQGIKDSQLIFSRYGNHGIIIIIKVIF
jgi:hypothetical protein